MNPVYYVLAHSIECRLNLVSMPVRLRYPAMTMQDDKKRNISLIIGLSIPVAMIIFIAIAINGPRWFNTVEPAKFDFLYTTGQYSPFTVYRVSDGKLTIKKEPVPEGANPVTEHPLHFFVHDVSENTSREIQLEEALALALDSSIRSPDGFAVETGRRSGWFIFGYRRDYSSRYLVKESFGEKLALESSNGSYNYYWNFQFLGWVTDSE